MVSPISIPGFPSVHTRRSAATCDSALESRLAAVETSLAALIDSLPSLIATEYTKAFDNVFDASFEKFRRGMLSRGAEEGISAPLATDHHVSPAIEPIQLPRSPICAEGAQSQLIPSAIQAPPLLSPSPLLRALATSAVKPHSKHSAAATVSFTESKTGIHTSMMTSAPRLLHEHSFFDTTKTGPEDFCVWNLFDEIPDSSCYAVLACDMCYCNGIRDKGGGSKIRPLEDCRMRLGEKIAQSVYDDNIDYFIKKKLHVWYQLPCGLWELGMVRGHEVLLLFGVIACCTGHCAIVYHVFMNAKYGWVNWYLVGKFVKKNFYALHLFDEMSKRHNMENISLSSNLEALDIVVIVCRSLPKDLAASFTEENGTLGHINAIKQFRCLSLLHSCALTVMAISQLDYSIFTSLLSKLNQELCNRADVHLDAIFFPNCVANDQIFQQPGWCHTLIDPCDNISYQRVVFNQRNYTIWLMDTPCILLSFKVVEENGKRKGFGFVQFDKEDSDRAAASAFNDTIRKGKNLYVSIFVQKSKNDNRLRILSNTLNPALSQEVVCYKGLELATNITEACNNRVFGQIVLLLVQIVTTMIRLLEEYANLKGLQDGHFRQEEEVFAILSHKHRNEPLKIKEIISMVANSLTSLLNLEIEFKLLLQEDGTTTASILFFLVYGMHFKEQWKSRTTPYVTIPEQHCVSHHVFSYVIGKRWILVELELHHKKTVRHIWMLTFGSEEVLVFRLNLRVDDASVYAWLYDYECICKVCHQLKVILLDDMAHINVLVAAGVFFFACSSGRMSIIFVFAWSLHICLTVSVSWQNELFKFLELDTKPPYVFKCQLYTLTEVMKDMVEALGLLRSSKSSMHNIGVAYDGLKFNDFNDSERIAVFNIQDRLVPSISLFQKMEFYDNQTLSGPSITDKSYEMCFHEGKMTEKDITPIRQSLLNQTARLALEDIKLRTISKAIILGNGPIVIVAALVENLLAGSLGVGPFSPFDVAALFLATSMEIEMILWVEIYEEATGNKCSLTKLWGAAITSSEVLSGSSPQVVSYLHIVIAAPPASLLLQDSLVSARSNKFFNFQP